jgi:UDP-N-acetylglucosamine:LPS N-acetylglucosamine transferase
MPTRPLLILSASMGAGHDGAAAELARRLSADGVDAEVVDVLELLPLRLGRALRWSYRAMIRHAPWLYAAIYRIFFVPDRAPSTSPLTALLAARLERLVRRRRPVAVASTFHLAAQAAGHLRERGRLAVPSIVVLTDFAVHRLWLHPGSDGYLCPTAEVALCVTAATGRPAYRTAPLVRPEFGRPRTDLDQVRDRIGVRPGDRLVLIATGAWGVGRAAEAARVLARSGEYVPVVLCGRNDRLRRRLRGCVALGWRDDVPALMAAAYAVIDNAAGLTCKEALAAGVPVVTYRPIPGHGRGGAEALEEAGLSVHARDETALLAALDALDGTPQRERQVARGSALYGFECPAQGVIRAYVRIGGDWASRMLP